MNEKKTAFLIIEGAVSEPQLDHEHKMIPDGNGGFIQRPRKDSWQMLLPHDIPEWVKGDDAMTRMVKGEEISLQPEKGGRWYRALRITEETKVIGADGVTLRPIGDIEQRVATNT